MGTVQYAFVRLDLEEKLESVRGKSLGEVDEANVFAFYRFCEGETSLVILNAGSKLYQANLKEKGWQKVFPLPSTDNPTVVSPEQAIAVPACCVEIIQKKVKVQK